MMEKSEKKTCGNPRKRDRINKLAQDIGDLYPRLVADRGGHGTEIHTLKKLVSDLHEELKS
jgi:hypothetical protein